jgi:hypothetical protein
MSNSAGYTTRSGRRVKRKIYSADGSLCCDSYHKALHVFFAKIEQTEIGGKIFMEKTKRNWNLQPKPFSFNKRP